MMTPNIILFIVLGLSITATLYNYRKARIERKANASIFVGLEELMHATRLEITKNKKLVESAREAVGESYTSETSEHVMDDPVMLASILTVIIKKYGSLKLGLDDFELAGSDAYVSVYIDTKTQDLILSLDHGLVEKEQDPMSMVNFGAKDDNTFH
tara:strand:+ start:385 stop:852 length:468 start_codon:yes stop_codon:yes gene_type:complete